MILSKSEAEGLIRGRPNAWEAAVYYVSAPRVALAADTLSHTLHIFHCLCTEPDMAARALSRHLGACPGPGPACFRA